MTITLRQLRYLEALATAGHFGRAAEASGISQPALSMQIRELEGLLGGAVVERTAAGATLTELGREAVARGARILALVRDLEELGAAHGAVLSGPLRLGVIPSVAPYLLPNLITGLARDYPALRLTVRESVTRVLTAELAAGALDAVVASVPLGMEDLAEEHAFDDRFLLAVPAGSAHARRKPALAELVSADELLLLEDGHCLRDQALEVCAAIDPRRLRSYGATSLSTILHLVAAGQGITFVPEMAVDAALRANRDIALVPFAAPAPHRTIGVAWRRSSPRRADFEALAEMVQAARPHAQ
jgi:LysR family hydrogen peroxide-inducible transcriptional activator